VSGIAAGAVEHAVGRQPDPDPVRTDGRDRGTGHLERKAIAAFDAVAVIVAAPIHIGIQELLDQIAIGGMQLDAIEARFDGELRRHGWMESAMAFASRACTSHRRRSRAPSTRMLAH
jgi:hypothetical protein